MFKLRKGFFTKIYEFKRYESNRKMQNTNYVFFWKSDETNGVYCQWFSSNFVVDGVTYTTAEQYMMHKKAMLFQDLDIARQCLETKDPHEIKKLGRTIQNFSEDLWLQNRESIVFDANYAKFSQNSDLKEIILSQYDGFFVEASPLDKIWGIGFSEKKALANRQKWGLNLLGKAIHLVALRLHEESLNS